MNTPATITYPKLRSEAEVQAEIYWALKLAGFNPRLEVPAVVFIEHGGRTKRVGCRFDVVVFDKLIPLCIIECKKTVNPAHRMGQLPAYLRFGVPVYMGWENNVSRLVDQCLKLARLNCDGRYGKRPAQADNEAPAGPVPDQLPEVKSGELDGLPLGSHGPDVDKTS